MSVHASVYTPHTACPSNLRTFNADGSRINPSTSSHHDSQELLPKNDSNNNNNININNSVMQDPLLDKTYAITPHRVRSQLLVNNLKASGILPYQADETGRPPQLKHSARGLEAIGFDENASMYSSYKGEGQRRVWKDDGGGKEKKVGGKRRFLKKLVGKGEEKGEKL
ncbi:hypothetical protein HO173_008537 [Letharia columbiana]|uniref:Uncharacterized protein n=1 Tax=Letharia columbiana TaxID=112416 RepID=A0A8H6L2P1_9LECA|nr:uncharacterized protein HO173_008537 [Letharia columbiana]KAF6233248.1 hypothetical protein HO173_008537 [Letharia columbiana]